MRGAEYSSSGARLPVAGDCPRCAKPWIIPRYNGCGAGRSVGAAFAVRLGARLNDIAPEKLAGAVPSLRAEGVDVVHLGVGSTHLDAEGEDGDAVGPTACGTPQRAAVETPRTRAAQWLRNVAAQPSK